MFVFPAVAAVVAAVFAARCVQRARGGRSVALGVWAFALVQFAIASAALAIGVAAGWTIALFRVYYLFGAILNIGWLALGTVWLLAPRRVAESATLFVAAGSIIAATALLSAPAALHAVRAIPRSSDVLPGGVRLYSRIFSIAGSLVVLCGLGWSILRRRSHAAGLGLLALGVLIVGVGGELGRAGLVVGFSASLGVGIAVMYAGFLRAR